MFCAHCGKETRENETFCSFCGKEINKNNQRRTLIKHRKEKKELQLPKEIKEEEVIEFVDENYTYYHKIWTRYPDPSKFAGVNLVFLFFPILYMGHRKMHNHAMLYTLVLSFLALFPGTKWLILGLHLLCSGLINREYYKYTIKSIQKINESSHSVESKQKKFAKLGGVSFSSMIASLVACAIIDACVDSYLGFLLHIN